MGLPAEEAAAETSNGMEIDGSRAPGRAAAEGEASTFDELEKQMDAENEAMEMGFLGSLTPPNSTMRWPP